MSELTKRVSDEWLQQYARDRDRVVADVAADCRDARVALTAAEQRYKHLAEAYNHLGQLIQSNSARLPPRIVQILYNETCCKPTPEQAKGEACACVAGHLVNEIEDWAAARVAQVEQRVQELEREESRHLEQIERMAEERHMLHGANPDRFWNCTHAACKSVSAYLRNPRNLGQETSDARNG